VSAQVREAVESWLEAVVVGLNLCPFAAPVIRAQGVRIVVGEGETPEDGVQLALEEAVRLLEDVEPSVSTTLVALPRGAQDFERFLDIVATVEEALDEAGAAGVLQVATFHPDYQFEGTEPEDVTNYTNRAPVPILHLLREADVEEAVDSHSDPEGIPERNMARLEELGVEGVAGLWPSVPD
jgi:hypothetical protein